ncbi:hypothetical protein [Helicobacter saguini]|nr:hypothetical protein [Helicobacter saguini]MWV69497.1 hypothetical protein [Helicobacter saguini]
MPYQFELKEESQFSKIIANKLLHKQKLKQMDMRSIQYENILPLELECCYNEFKYHKYIAKNKIAALGWAVSYNLQYLWQNSPKVDMINNFDIPIKQTKHMTQQEKQRL